MVLGAVILVSLTSVFVLLSGDWRYSVGTLAIQYIGVFLLVSTSWSLEMAVVKMVAGWMAVAILVIAMSSGPDHWRETGKLNRSSMVFKLMGAVILAFMTTSLVLNSGSWLSSLILPVRWGSILLVSMGLLQLSLTSHPLRVVIGLLTVFSGFEIIYASVETSVLVTGLLAGVNLGLALAGAYLLVAPVMEAG
jgi:hypothetical protein